MKTRSSASLLAAASFALFGCAIAAGQTSPSVDPSSYDERFDPWRACNRALEPASHGDRDAQITFFLSAYVRLSQPYTGGEDLGQMRDNFGRLLAALGDVAFCRALRQQRPEVQSAARWFLDMKRIQGSSPKTHHLLRGTQKIDWPTDRAYRAS